MAARLVFLVGVALVGAGIALWVHAGAGLASAGFLVALDAWMPTPGGAK